MAKPTKQLRRDGWYLKKSFPHFDLPLDFVRAEKLVKNPKSVSSHSFFPFIHYTDSKRQFRKIAGKKVVKLKSRPLRYCGHRDGYIHSYYALKLYEKYEQYINTNGFGACITGYRRGLGSNINLARDVFSEISSRRKCVALCLDVSEFFDSIDHQMLQQNLQRVLGVDRLTADWFAIFKSMTKYAWVDQKGLYATFQIDRKKPARPICSAEEFRKIVRDGGPTKNKLIHVNHDAWGIPQGSPISATFSNVFMILFDQAVSDFCGKRNIFYRRYSDDIVLILPPHQEDSLMRKIKSEFKKLGSKMELNEEKTEKASFYKAAGTCTCDTSITYLGFTFDGQRVSIRGRTLSRYYRRMTYATRHTAKNAKRNNSNKIFRRKLKRDFTHWGHSNFYSYARDASSIFGDSTPKRQLRRHAKILDRKLLNRGR